MSKRLFIDLEVCAKCKDPKCTCSYFYHPGNDGITSLREMAAFAIICRQCEEAPCVNSCTKEALEKQENGILKRYNMRCVGCKSCTLACPFGTIYPEIIPYLVSKCDWCIGRADGKLPICVETCPENAVRFEEIEESKEKNIYFVGDNLAVHVVPWKVPVPEKKG